MHKLVLTTFLVATLALVASAGARRRWQRTRPATPTVRTAAAVPTATSWGHAH